MAEVAVVMIWMFRCSECEHYSRHWDLSSSVKAGEYHLHSQHSLLLRHGWEYETEEGPKRVPWAFRVVHDLPPISAPQRATIHG